ncbi:MAG: AbrB/MazE/SpoVT family DNA-binding domain-containing protein [Candidatus Peregrinibacteria bacterium]
MNYTAIPSVKGQITIPSTIREKYGISKETPVIISDNNDGTIMIKVMKMVEHDDIAYREDENGVGLGFKRGINPQILIDAINDIDG